MSSLSPFNQRHEMPALSAEKVQGALIEVMARVYGLMGAGLIVTAIIASWAATSEPLLRFIVNRNLFMGLLIGEIALVFAIGAIMRRTSPTVGMALFFLYSAVNGLTMAIVFLLYTGASIALAFGTTAIVFGLMSVIGYTTRQDLSGWGKFLLIALVGLIVASILNFFLASTALDWILTYAGLFLFLALTMYHTQRIKHGAIAALHSGDERQLGQIVVIGALALYLDFINIFLRLLRIFGRRR